MNSFYKQPTGLYRQKHITQSGHFFTWIIKAEVSR
jgi:hypothetical protein